MTELISRRAALYEIDKNRDSLLQSGMKGAEHILVHYGRRAIEELPPIEPKRGKWIYKNFGGWHCSLCDKQAPFWCMASTQNLSNYCPNCGAKMERSEE